LHLQYLAKNQSTQRCQSLITQGSDPPPVLEPHMVLSMLVMLVDMSWRSCICAARNCCIVRSILLCCWVILELSLILWCGSRPGVHHLSVRIMGFRYYNKEISLKDETTWTSRLRQIMLVPTSQVPVSLWISINYEISPEPGVKLWI
jgi:hypothetical protein